MKSLRIESRFLFLFTSLTSDNDSLLSLPHLIFLEPKQTLRFPSFFIAALYFTIILNDSFFSRFLIMKPSTDQTISLPVNVENKKWSIFLSFSALALALDFGWGFCLCLCFILTFCCISRCFMISSHFHPSLGVVVLSLFVLFVFGWSLLLFGVTRVTDRFSFPFFCHSIFDFYSFIFQPESHRFLSFLPSLSLSLSLSQFECWLTCRITCGRGGGSVHSTGATAKQKHINDKRPEPHWHSNKRQPKQHQKIVSYHHNFF